LPASSTDRDPFVTARLMRTRAEAAPFWLDVSGTSMGWSIPSGTRVRVDATASPRRGEVWAFCNDTGDIVVHRFRRATGGGLRFQGDARVRADDSVEDAQLIGRVVELAPPRAPRRWGPLAGAVQRVPRVAIARTVRVARRVAAGGHR
jgi:phage repressor protein C with HTH and peptisase S24 domain